MFVVKNPPDGERLGAIVGLLFIPDDTGAL
jgi:hypothetical protein